VLVPAGDASALADVIGTLVSEPALAARLGRAARATIVRRFSSADVATRWLRAYQLLPRPM